MLKRMMALACGGLSVVLAGAALPALGESVTVAAEATIRAGGQADVDQDESLAGYVHVKHDEVERSARHAYFQFDLSEEDVDLEAQAAFSIFIADRRDQAIRVWVLDQAYADFNDQITWNSAQGNDPNTNNLRQSGRFTATQLSDIIAVDASNTVDEVKVTIQKLAPFVFEGKITLVVTGADDSRTEITNDAGGLRIAPKGSEHPAKLEFAVAGEDEGEGEGE